MPVALEVATPATFDALAHRTGELVVVCFWAPDCAPCASFRGDLPELLRDLPSPGVRLVTVNAAECPELARRFALVGVPAFVLLRDGRRLGMMRHYAGREAWLSVVLAQLRGAAAHPG